MKMINNPRKWYKIFLIITVIMFIIIIVFICQKGTRECLIGLIWLLSILFVLLLLKPYTSFLQDEAKILAAIFAKAPIGLIISIGASDKIRINKVYEEMVGRTRKEISRMGWMAFTHKEDLEKEKPLYEDLINGNIDSYDIDKRYHRPNGEEIWVNVKVVRLKVPIRRKRERYICIVQDISERMKKLQEEIDKRKSKDIILANIPGMAYRCLFRNDWQMQFVSSGCERLTGYKNEELLYNSEVSYNDLIAKSHRDHVWKLVNDSITNRTEFNLTYPIVDKFGIEKWVFEQGKGIYKENGECDYLEGLIVDITDRKKKEDENYFLSYHDFMTGLFNRRYLEKVREEIEDVRPISVVMVDIDGLKMINDTFGHENGDLVIIKSANLIKSVFSEEANVFRVGGDEFLVLVKNMPEVMMNASIRSLINICEKKNSNETDIENMIYLSIGGYCLDKKDESLNHAMQNAETHMYENKLIGKKSFHSRILSAVQLALEEKSNETKEHAQRMTELAREFARYMNLSYSQTNKIELLGAIHDIGKIGIREEILTKKEPLSESDWTSIKKHPEIGYRIAKSTTEFEPVAMLVKYHHERWDGKGYPEGIEGEKIPILARMIAIVDAYDAMTNERIYKEKISKEEALIEIEKNSGSQFDPHLAKAFVEMIRTDETNTMMMC